MKSASTACAFAAGAAFVIALSACGSDLNLHHVDWKNVAVPGAVCGARAPDLTPLVAVQLHDGSALAHSTRFPNTGLVEIDDAWDPVVYGRLYTDGQEAAALGVDCNNGGGTADGVMAYARVLYTSVKNRLSVVGILRPRVSSAADSLPTFLNVARIEPGEMTVVERFYGGSDGTCCPSGRATTIWRLSRGHLVSTSTKVTRRPVKLG